MKDYINYQLQNLSHGRATGNTTRQANWIIDQMFIRFNNYKGFSEDILVADHWDLFAGAKTNTTDFLLEKVTKRLETEFKIYSKKSTNCNVKYVVKSIKTLRNTIYQDLDQIEDLLKKGKLFYLIRLEETK